VEVVKRICLLTGASGPLGTAFLERFGDDYDIVAVHHRRPVYAAAQHQEFVDPLDPAGPVAANAHRVHAIRADLGSPAEVDAAVNEAIATFGCVDLLVNAAAVRRFSPLVWSDVEQYAEASFRINVLAPVRIARALAEGCWSADTDENVLRRRNIVNVSSTAGLYVFPDLGQGLYAATKAALNQLTYHLANELWDLGIRVNAVAPDTFPGRVPTSDVLDAIAAFDAAEETGEVLAVVGEDAAA
jgi:NAD(P)-dependent dehydrogenase (short-subunit alcohol dehydrogenase family)